MCTPPPVNRITDRYKNITFPQPRLRTVMKKHTEFPHKSENDLAFAFAFVPCKCPLTWTAFIRWTTNKGPGGINGSMSRINLLINQFKAKSIVIFTENYWHKFVWFSEMRDSNETTDYIDIVFFDAFSFSIETDWKSGMWVDGVSICLFFFSCNDFSAIGTKVNK